MVSSTDFLVDHAYRNVWCSPGQDRQHIVGPKRITKRQGAVGNFSYGMRVWNLPTAKDWYHIFAIGDLPPELVGMDQIKDKWVSAKAHSNNTSLLIDTYLNNGIRIPTFCVYFLYTYGGAMLVAIKDVRTIVHLGLVQPFIRWRSNAYFDDPNNQIPKNGGIEIDGLVPTTQQQFSLFQAKWRAAKLAPGYAMAYVNGRRVNDINITTAVLGDYIEYVRDASIKEVLQIKTKDLKSFDSIRDNKGKYLLPRPGLGTVIDYCDDVDIFVLNYKLAAAYNGLYYHQNQPDALRMVTHRDYSIPTAYLRGIVEGNKDWIWNDDLRVEVIIRHSGWVRDLVDEAHRIKELFKLPEDRRLNAMIGEASVSVWKAANLENSQYVKIMGMKDGSITRSVVEEAYGYNAISRLIADTPFKVEVGNNGWIKLPFGLTSMSTVYEYDNAGLLIDWYIHDNSIQYPIRNPGVCKYIEAYAGRGGVGLSTVYNKPTLKLEKGVDYRYYASEVRNGVSLNKWRDVTGDPKFVTVANGVATWNVLPTKWDTAIKNSKDFLSYSIDLNYRDDLLAMTINATEIKVGLAPAPGVMDIPPGQLDVFMNGHGLVYKVDYYVQWPMICIVNKAYLVNGPVQNVVVRGRGYCNSDMTLEEVKDKGWVAYGMLSHNSGFNVRDDKVTVVEIGGQLYSREEVKFSEDGNQIMTTVPNGTPYQIKQPIIPMMGITDEDTYSMRAKSEAIDKEVEDYLTAYLPEPVQPNPNPIPAWYRVYSPFVTKLIFDMLNGILTMDEFKGEYGLEYVKERLQGYDWILPFDPALNNVDENYIVIDPHPELGVVSLNIYQYRLLDRAVEVFLDNKVRLNRYTVIVEEGFEHYAEDTPHPHRKWEEVEA